MALVWLPITGRIITVVKARGIGGARNNTTENNQHSVQDVETVNFTILNISHYLNQERIKFILRVRDYEIYPKH